MGFLGGLGRVLRGEPVFVTATAPQTSDAPVEVQTSADMSPPVVMVGRIESSTNDSQTDIYGDIHNGSSEDIFLDKIIFNGNKRELDITLKPGESRQFLIYRGGNFASEPHGYADVQYRAKSGHYYNAQHTIHTKQRSFGYEVVELELIMPIHKVA